MCCPGVLCYWTVPPVVTRGVEPSELNGKHICAPHRCINLMRRGWGGETMTSENSCPRELIAEGTRGKVNFPVW